MITPIIACSWYLNDLKIIKVALGSNEVSALTHFYLHPLRFAGVRFDCIFFQMPQNMNGVEAFFTNYFDSHVKNMRGGGHFILFL